MLEGRESGEVIVAYCSLYSSLALLNDDNGRGMGKTDLNDYDEERRQ